MNERYQGKRFFGFLLSIGALCGGFLSGNPELFATFASSLAVLYGLYLGGQTYTDSRNGKTA
jgi:hypothetical protein